MRTISEAIAQEWEHFKARSRGPLRFRCVMQPTVASILAIRAGIRDARAGRHAYLWGAITSATDRKELLTGSLRHLLTPFVTAIVLDVIYQIILHRRKITTGRTIHVLELIYTALVLAVVPYIILRGPVNRVASLFLNR